MGDFRRVAVFGGVYSNHLALRAAVDDARSRGAEALICLGDLGAFGPHPDRVFPLLRDEGIPVVRGNYDDSLARGLDDCQCGYTDPRDNHFAHLSYRYTFENTSPRNRRWMAGLPRSLRFRLGGLEVLACHGSPRQMNEFLWETTTPTHFLTRLVREHGADVGLGTHTGLHWSRGWDGDGEGLAGLPAADASGPAAPPPLPSGSVGLPPGGGAWVNAGALGRPANDGRTEVWYALLEGRGRELDVTFVPVAYDHARLADEMRAEGLPEEFVETILTGWWTTCLEILPGKERARGRF
ncbi:MAG: metallophosphatase family protein [Gemmatimonadetes bacterium]|nr:metallophosphatase family protein [Gemmatimonadota bacterium]